MPKFEVHFLIPVTAYVEALNQVQAAKRGAATVNGVIDNIPTADGELDFVAIGMAVKPQQTEQVKEWDLPM